MVLKRVSRNCAGGVCLIVGGLTFACSNDTEPTVGEPSARVTSQLSWTQHQELTGPSRERFGAKLSLSADTAVVAAQFGLYPFVRSDTRWVPGPGIGTISSLDDGAFQISGDTFVVGSGHTSAWVHVRSSGVWSLQQQLKPDDLYPGHGFGGNAVAVSGDTIAIGAQFLDDGPIPRAGRAFVFVRSDGVWREQQRLMASDAASGDYFGSTLALVGDTLLVGARHDDHGGLLSAGSVYVFTRANNVWSERQKLTASDPHARGFFGGSIAVSGNTAVISASGTDSASEGSAYVFVRSGNVWVEQQKLTASDGSAFDWFGSSVGVSTDRVVVGAAEHTHSGHTRAGSAYVFARAGNVWSQEHKLIASDAGPDDGFGWSVGIADGTVWVTAPGHDHAGEFDTGSAYVFELGTDGGGGAGGEAGTGNESGAGGTGGAVDAGGLGGAVDAGGLGGEVDPGGMGGTTGLGGAGHCGGSMSPDTGGGGASPEAGADNGGPLGGGAAEGGASDGGDGGAHAGQAANAGMGGSPVAGHGGTVGGKAGGETKSDGGCQVSMQSPRRSDAAMALLFLTLVLTGHRRRRAVRGGECGQAREANVALRQKHQ